MGCKNICRLCDNLVISTAVTLADGTLTINLPADSFDNGEKVCLVVAQAIPDTTAPVVITIGTDTTEYPLTTCDCAQVTARALRTRTRYATRVITNSEGAVFRLLGKVACAPSNALASIGGSTV